MTILCPEDFSKSGISASITGCKAEADRSLISAALAVLPAVMPNKASPKEIVAKTLRMLRRFILSLRTRCRCPRHRKKSPSRNQHHHRSMARASRQEFGHPRTRMLVQYWVRSSRRDNSGLVVLAASKDRK